MEGMISVIVPVYNVAAYLPECLDSILKQDYENLEILVIDDGSTDGSSEICDKYAACDPRISVIHQKNGGAANAKNAGLRIATGEYLSFVDSDDYLEPGAYSHMVGLLRETGADVVQCSFRDVFRDGSKEGPKKENRTYSAEQYLEGYTRDWTCGLLWDKLYRRSAFGDVFFEEGHRIDDEYFTYQGIMNAVRICTDTRVVYNYRKRRSSVMWSPDSAALILLDRIDYLSKRRKNVIARFPGLRKAFDRHFAEMMVILSRDPCCTKESMVRIRKELIAYGKEKGHTPINWRLWASVVRIFLISGEADKKQAPDCKTDMSRYFD